MLKEIFEQPNAVRDTVLGRVSLDTAQVFSRSDGDHAGGPEESGEGHTCWPAARRGMRRWWGSS